MVQLFQCNLFQLYQVQIPDLHNIFLEVVNLEVYIKLLILLLLLIAISAKLKLADGQLIEIVETRKIQDSLYN